MFGQLLVRLSLFGYQLTLLVNLPEHVLHGRALVSASQLLNP